MHDDKITMAKFTYKQIIIPQEKFLKIFIFIHLFHKYNRYEYRLKKFFLSMFVKPYFIEQT